MASSSSSFSSSSTGNLTISQEEFKLYHTIDRNIFARLILNLGRDPGESMQVMALLLWLENFSKHARNLIYFIQPWPDTLISTLADEAVQCLKCIRTDEFSFFGHIEGENSIIPLIRKLTKNELSLRYFHDHRLDIVRGIVRLVQDVCVRAFDDIIMQQAAAGLMVPKLAAGAADHQERQVEQNLDTLRLYGPLIRPVLPLYNYYYSGVGDFGGDDHHNRGNNIDQQIIFRPNTDHTDDSSGFSNEIDEVLKRIQVVCINSMEENNNKNKEVGTDDRTIFLTFSKGYPISENEVTEFFTRKFGENLIEVIEMQEVSEGEQPLYARLILKSASGLEKVLNGKPKVKFSINGKHVWSRKFVPRNIKSSFESDHLP